MRPVDVYLGSSDGVGSIGVYGEAIGAYEGLSLVGQAAVQAFATVLVAALVLGVLRQYGTQTVELSRRSPIISLCIGLPGALVLGGFGYTGILLSSTDIGVFFAIPLVAATVTLLPASTALGFAALGGVIASRLGTDRKFVWVIVGGVISGLTALAPLLGFVVITLAASLGVGAGVRVLFGNGGVRQTNERVVPPANKV